MNNDLRNNKLCRRIAVLCLAFATQSGCTRQPSDSEQVVSTFHTYKQAVLAQKGKDAVSLVNRRTLDYFGQIMNHALYSSKADVQKLRTVDKFMVLRVRHQVKAEDLKKMSPADFFAYGIDRGWTSKESTMNLEIGRVDVAGDAAKAETLIGGKKAPPAMAYVFSKENKKWKLDMLPTMGVLDQVLKQSVRQGGLQEDEFVFDLIETVSGTKVSGSVWNPLLEEKK